MAVVGVCHYCAALAVRSCSMCGRAFCETHALRGTTFCAPCGSGGGRRVPPGSRM